MTRPPEPAVGRAAAVALLVCALFWGGSFVAAKIALAELDPMRLAASRFAVAAVVFIPAVVVYHLRGERLSLRDLPVFIVLGLLGVTTYYWFQFTGVRYTTATNVALLVTLSPVWTVLFSHFFIGDRLDRRRAIGFALAFVGAALVVTKGRLDLSTSRNDAIGALFILANTVAWATYTIVGQAALRTRPAFFVTAWVSLLGLAMMLPPLLWTGELRVGWVLTARTWAAVIFLGLLCTAVGYSLWYYALQHVRADTATTYLYLEPLVTALVSAAMLGERFPPATVVGGVAIIAGVWRVGSLGAHSRSLRR